MKKFEFFAGYLVSKRKTFAVFALFCGIFAFTFYLYDLPIEAVLYPALLCALSGGVIVVFDAVKIYRTHERLQTFRSFSDLTDAVLPQSDGVITEDYKEIIRLITEEQSAYRSETNMKYSDMIDYYTVWAHQIKTPIASMRLNLQNEDSDLARKLNFDLCRIEQYVEMVITFLRLDSESTDYVIKEYDLDRIVKQAIRKFSSEFISRKLNLVYKAEDVSVITDEKWLSFVIEQVLSNALKYTRSGGITVNVTSEKKLFISDTGIGIAPEDIPRIFENGYTGYNGRTDKKASGIGLYLCRRICDKLGHSISVTSAVDVGTTVEIDLAGKKISFE